MTNLQAVEKLIELGYSVTHVKRSDGGIWIKIITDSSGKKIFDQKGHKNNSAGNKKAKELLKAAGLLDDAKEKRKIAQRKKAGKKAAEVRKEFGQSGLDKYGLTKEEKAAIAKAQKEARKASKGGKISRKQYRQRKKREGAKRAKEGLQNALLHLQGYSYRDQIQAFIDHLKTTFPGVLGQRELIDFLTPYARGEKLFKDEDLTALMGLWSGSGPKAINQISDAKQRYEETKIIISKYK